MRSRHCAGRPIRPRGSSATLAMMVEPEAELPVLGEAAEDRFGLEELLQQREREGADQRAAQMADAAEDDHDQHRAR